MPKETPGDTVSGVVWITGGANGLGRGLAVGLASAGWHVAVSDIDQQAVDNLRDELAAIGPSLVTVGDVTSSNDIHRILDEVEVKLGPLDALINNALFAVRGSVLDVTEADWRRAVEVNLTGYFLCAQAAARRMVLRKVGRIVNLSSGAAERGIPGTVAYGCAKGGVNAMTRIFAVELAQHGICVNTVTTGPVMTEGFATLAADAAGVEARRRRVPMGRLGTVEDCLGIIEYLLAPASAWTTGALFNVDGGANNAGLVQQVSQ
jgi:NAD(P)-dependent dehydrogenase (short-subunit alcohol dehydrogenase family)